MNAPFPWHLWVIALQASIKWVLAYQPPPGEATGGEVTVIVQPKEK
jgi:hypothetical protein